MRIPVLSYGPMHIDGNDYRSNDTCALAADIRHLNDAGFAIVPLSLVVDAWLDNRGVELDGRLVALTTDNGADFNFRDLDHPRWGMQRSVFNILRDFARDNPGAQPRLNVTAFSIASPQAREALDKTCMIGKGWWSDDWWPEAIGSGLLHIGNHSWDHNHETLPAPLRKSWRTGTFALIDSLERADYEIRTAAEYLRDHVSNPGARLFAYPYGDSNAYLVREYLPDHGAELGIRAAFTKRAGFLEPGTGRWEVPRFACGRDWRSPVELQQILDAAVLHQLSRPDEIVVGVDLFVGCNDTKAEVARVQANIAAACGDHARLKVIVADSMDLTPESLLQETGGPVRFASIDGGHTRELVRKDLESCTPILQAGGIMALDDAFNFGTPGVIEGITDFFHEANPALAPFAICYNKLFVTTPDFHARYVQATLDFLEEVTWLPTRDRSLAYRKQSIEGHFTPTMFGYEIVPFA